MLSNKKLFKSLNGLRLGQAIYTAINKHLGGADDDEIGNALYFIEDDELIKTIKDLLKKESI